MNLKQYLNNLTNSSEGYGVMLGLIILLWIVTLIIVGGYLFLFVERSSQAQLPPPGQPIAAITIEPAVALAGSSMTVHGSDWPTGATVLLYLTTPDENRIPIYAVTEATVDAEGRFTTTFNLLPESQWVEHKSATVIAHAQDGQVVAQATFTILSWEQAPTATVELSSTETAPTLEPTSTLEPAATSTPTLVSATGPAATVAPSATALPRPVSTATPAPTAPTRWRC